MSPKKDKKKKKDKEAKSAGAAVTTLLKAKGERDTVELTLEWQGGEAVLASLTDNGDPVDFGRSQGVGETGLVVSWDSPDAFVHVLQWDLWFLGTRTDLKATATVNGRGGFAKPVKSSSQKDRWSASGAAEE